MATQTFHKENPGGFPGSSIKNIPSKVQGNARLGGPRSFGDISNRAGDVIRTPNVKNQLKLQPKALSFSKPIPQKVVKPREDLEFRPVFMEVEDYDDILPPHLKISTKHAKDLSRIWAKDSATSSWNAYSHGLMSPKRSDLDILECIPVLEEEPLMEETVFELPDAFY